MKNFTKELIDELASKLLIGLNEEENKMVLNEFNEIDHNMNLINDIADIANIKPMTHPIELNEIVLRDDDEIEELKQEEVLQNAGEKNMVSVIIPKVVKE